MTTTLLELKTRARERADMENNPFIKEPELTSYINASAEELYDILVSKYADYFFTKIDITITSGTNSTSLPADFFKFRGLDFKVSPTDFLNVYKFNFEQRNSKNRSLQRSFYRYAPYREYRLMGSTLFIEPADNAAGDYQLWYVPSLALMVNDTDTFDGINGWEEYIIVDAAIKMLTKEESDTTGLMMQKAGLLKRIEDLSAERDISEPETIADVSLSNEWNRDIL